MARTRKSASALFDAIILEGNLITPAMLTRIAAHEAGAQSEADYSVPKGLTLRDEIARYFRIGQALFQGAICQRHAVDKRDQQFHRSTAAGCLRIFGSAPRRNANVWETAPSR